MTLCRMILPDYLKGTPGLPNVLEGVFSEEQIKDRNAAGYGVYFLPNHPKRYKTGTTIDGSHIDTWRSVFVDYDLKTGTYPSIDDFIEVVGQYGLDPSKIVLSGHGAHVYWDVKNLDAMSYLRFQRRLCRLFKTDPAVGKIFQLMRLPGTVNTKKKDEPKQCEVVYDSLAQYTCEELDKALPPITKEDEQYCQNHYDQTYNLKQSDINLDLPMPAKWGQLLNSNSEVKALWSQDTDDRSKNDYRLGHLMFANNFTREEAMLVLSNTAKASSRSPNHKYNYAKNIVDKIWTYELTPDAKPKLSMTVGEILGLKGDNVKGTRIRCHPIVDNTEYGFRLGQVMGLVAGSGVGKTSFALNMFRWFAQGNPDLHHFFIPLEQPAAEIANRWATMCGDDTALHHKVHVISNYDEDGNFRHLSFDEIKEYILQFTKETGHTIGSVVIDHIGALKKKGKEGENQDLMDICHSMKAFAVQTNTFLVMQSQTSRSKAGIGDLELDKDAAFGTMYFEAYCDYLLVLWQPLKRCHREEGCPTVSAIKFCKIRHKKQKKDVIQEDVPYYLYFDSDTEQYRKMNQIEIKAFEWFAKKASNKRTADKNIDVPEYQQVGYTDKEARLWGTNKNTTH